MTKELNFNKDDIARENQAFYDYQAEQFASGEDIAEATKKDDGRTWYCYFLKCGNTTIVGMKTADKLFAIPLPNRTFAQAKRIVMKRYMRTNLDRDCNTQLDKNLLKECEIKAKQKANQLGIGHYIMKGVKTR